MLGAHHREAQSPSDVTSLWPHLQNILSFREAPHLTPISPRRTPTARACHLWPRYMPLPPQPASSQTASCLPPSSEHPTFATSVLLSPGKFLLSQQAWAWRWALSPPHAGQTHLGRPTGLWALSLHSCPALPLPSLSLLLHHHKVPCLHAGTSQDGFY